MKRTVIEVALVLAMVFAAWQFGQAQAQLADFNLMIDASAGAARLECTKGCSWAKLNFKCTGKATCKAEVDQRGIGRVGIE